MTDVALHFARPWLLGALLLPVLVWWLTQRPRQPEEASTGTLSVWREAVEASEPTRALRRRTPPWSLLLALTLGALALAGPRTARAAVQPRTLVLDRSPSMHLALGAGTRLERAIELAVAELERLEAEPGGAAPRRWVSFGPEGELTAAGERPPAAWLDPGRYPQPEPAWERFDRPRTWWVTDGVPAAPRDRAGLALSGGDAVPGPVAVAGTGALITWDGDPEHALEPSLELPERRAVSIDSELSGPLRALAELWARERGLAITVRSPAPDTTLPGGPSSGGGPSAAELRGEDPTAPALELIVSGPAGAAAEGVELLGRGWTLGVRARPGGLIGTSGSGGGAARTPWLAAGGAVHVLAGPGRVELSFGESEEPGGQPAAFALAWAELFDRCLLPPEGVVSVAERRAVGPAGVVAPKEASEGDRAPWPPPAGGWPFEALLSGLAAALVLWNLRRP